MPSVLFWPSGKLLAAQVPWWAAAARGEVATTPEGTVVAPAALRPLPQREASPAVGEQCSRQQLQFEHVKKQLLFTIETCSVSIEVKYGDTHHCHIAGHLFHSLVLFPLPVQDSRGTCSS